MSLIPAIPGVKILYQTLQISGLGAQRNPLATRRGCQGQGYWIRQRRATACS